MSALLKRAELIKQHMEWADPARFGTLISNSRTKD